MRCELCRTVGLAMGLLTRREKFWFWLFTSIRMALNGLDLLGVFGLAYVLASISIGEEQSTISIGQLAIPPIKEGHIAQSLVGIAILFTLKSAGSILILRNLNSFLAEVEARLSRKVQNRVYGGNLENLSSLTPGEIQWAIGQSSHVAFSGLLFSYSVLLSEVTLTLTLSLAFLSTEPILALFVGIFFAISGTAYYFLLLVRQKRISKEVALVSMQLLDAVEGVNSIFAEIAPSIRRFRILEHLSGLREKYAKLKGTERANLLLPRYILEIALVVAATILALFGIISNSNGSVFPLVVFVGASFRLMTSIMPLQNALLALRTMSHQAEKAQRLVSHPALPRPTVRQHKSSKSHALAQIDDLRVGHDAGRPILGPLDLKLHGPALITITGESGSGKSTLLETIVGLRKPISGSILFSGEDPGAVFYKETQGISYVPQKIGFLRGSVRENLLLGLESETFTDDYLLRCLAEANLGELLDSRVGLLEAEMDSLTPTFSGGQQQRFAIARALVTGPRLLALDEPTSALDNQAESAIWKLLKELSKKRLVFVVTHNLEAIELSDFWIDCTQEGAIYRR